MSNFLTDRTAAESVKTANNRLPYPIKRTIKWKSEKTPEKYANNADAADGAVWQYYQKKEEGKGENITLTDFNFTIVATGFRVVNVDEVNKEFWQSSLGLNTKTDEIQIWSGGTKIFQGLYQKDTIKMKFPKAKYVNCLIVVYNGELVEIQAGSLLIEALARAASTFLGKKVNVFSLSSTPPLSFVRGVEGVGKRPKTHIRLNKSGEDWKGDECFFLPAYTAGIYTDNTMFEERRTEFMDWFAQSSKTAENHSEKEEFTERQPTVTEQVYGNIPNIEALDDSDDDLGLPF